MTSGLVATPGIDRRSWALACCFALVATICTGFVAIVLGPSGIAHASNAVASGGANDKVRCSSASIGSGPYKIALKCYFDPSASAFNSFASSTFTYSYGDYSWTAGPPQPRQDTYGTFSDNAQSYCASSTNQGQVENTVTYGPGAAFSGTLPAYSFASLCTGNAVFSFGYSVAVGSQLFSNRDIAVHTYEYCDRSFSGATCASSYYANGSYLWYRGIYATMADFLASPWSMDWYPGGSSADAEPFCGATVTINRANDDVIQHPDTVEFVTTPLVGRTGQVDAQFFDGSTAGFTTAETAWNMIRSSSAVGPTTTTTVTVPGTHALRAGAILLRCYDTVTSGYFYKNVSSATVVVDPSTVTPCSVAKWYWPDAGTTYAVGDPATFHLSYSGVLPAGHPTTIDKIESATKDPEGNLLVNPSLLTWSELSGAPFVLGTNVDKDVTAAYNGTAEQFTFRCTDWSGVSYKYQWSTPLQYLSVGGGGGGGSSAPYPGSETDCLAGANLSLHPSSWVPGLVHMAGCLLRFLFMPSSSSIDALQSAASAVLARAPFSWVAQGLHLVDISFAALESGFAAGGGACFNGVGTGSGPDADLNPVGTATVCASDGTSGFTTFPVRGILVWLFWLGVGWLVMAYILEIIGKGA